MKKTVLIAIAGAVALFAVLSLIGRKEVASGEKVGVFVNIAKQGRVFKTWEGELIRGGTQAGTGVNGRSFDFTVEDDSLAKRIGAAMEAGKEVKIKYHQEWFTFFRSESSNYFVTDFAVIEPKASPSPNKPDAGAPFSVSHAPTDKDELVRLLKVQGELLKVQAEILGHLVP